MIETNRLKLRAWLRSERTALANLLQHAPTMQHWPAPIDNAGVDAWLEKNVSQFEQLGYSRWCVELKVGDKANFRPTIVGDVGVRRALVRGEMVEDLGYIIHASHWGHGYGLEAAQAVVDWCRSHSHLLSQPKLVATMAQDNVASASTAERLGMMQVDSFVNAQNRDKLSWYYELPLAH